jgi:hypothetical protein
MIPLGYELGTGKRVSIPLNHMVVLGQTQLSGKTTTLEALVTRSGLKAVAFITKPGEKSFRQQTLIPAFFSESTLEEYSKYVAAIIEQKMSVRLGWRERGWIVKLCREYERAKTKTVAGYKWKQPKTLRELLANVEIALPHLRGTEEMICMQLQEYLKPAVKEIGHRQFSTNLELARGINVMDITDLSDGLKTLVIRSVIEWIHKKGRKIIVIVPEAWKFIPEGRSTPVKLALEGLIREGAGVENYVWMDSQDLRGVDKMLLRSVIVWLFGVQRQKNEVANTLASIPDYPKPTATEIMQLGKGEFYVCYGTTLVRTYVQPAGMEDEHARSIALGEEEPESWTSIVRSLDSEEKTVFDLPGLETQYDPVIDPAFKGMSKSAIAEAEASRLIGLHDSDTEEDDVMWKEKYEELCLELTKGFGGKPGDNTFIIEAVRQHFAILADRGQDGAKEIPITGEMAKWFEKFPKESLEATYQYVRKRLRQENPDDLLIGIQKPEIDVKVERKVITVEANGTLFGRICQLTGEGFFKQPQGAKAATAEAVRRGWCHPKTPVMRVETPLEELAKMGFLTRETDGYLMVPGMKISIQESK